MTKRAHDYFHIWRPDEAAECLPGMPQALYSKIWNEIVPLMPEGVHHREEFDRLCLARWWGRFTEEEQATLNRLMAEEVER